MMTLQALVKAVSDGEEAEAIATSRFENFETTQN
jgi:hypothetical protein